MKAATIVNVFFISGIIQIAIGNVIDVKKHDLLGTISEWGPEFKISFEVYVESFANSKSPKDGAGNRLADYLHFSASRDECCNMGDRIPVFRTVSNGTLYFATAINDQPNFESVSPAKIDTKTWYSIVVEQALKNGQWMLTFSVKIGGSFRTLLSKENEQPRSYKNVNIFSGMCTAANAKIRNLKYTGNGKELKDELKEIKDKNEELQTQLSALMTKLSALETAVSSQETKLKSVSRHGKWCGYKAGWGKSNSIITYDSLKFSSSNMDLSWRPLNINTGTFVVPVSGVWRVTFSMRSDLGKGNQSFGYIYLNNNELEESQHYNKYSSDSVYSTGSGREITLEATAGDTIYFKTGTRTDIYRRIYFCVAFEHGSDQ